MSKSENILAFEAALKENKDLRATYEAALKRITENKEATSDGEALVKAAAEVGFTLTMAELERAMAQIQKLDDEDLAQVSGGTDEESWSWCLDIWYCFLVLVHGDGDTSAACYSNYHCMFFEN